MTTYKRAKEYAEGDRVWIVRGYGDAITGKVLGEDPRWDGIAIMPSDAVNAIYVDADKILESAGTPQEEADAAQRRESRRAARDAWNRDHPQPWHGADRDRDYWEPKPWEQGR